MSRNLPPALPTGFKPLYDVQNMDSAILHDKKTLVSVFGVISSCQKATETKGRDWKCSVDMIDTLSTSENRLVMRAHFFGPQEKMMRFDSLGSVLILKKIKAQLYKGEVSLLQNWATSSCLLPASELDMVKGPPIAMAYKYGIDQKDISYAVWLRRSVLDHAALPSSAEFQLRAEQSMHTTDRFRLLKDVESGKYYDLVGEVISIREFDGRATIYLSDYTPNSLFYNQKPAGAQDDLNGRDGDDYGYTSKFRKQGEPNWKGPYGKLSIQLTLFDGRVQWALDNINPGQWVFIRNIKVEIGHSGGHLEGKLHSGSFNGGEIYPIDKTGDSADIDPRYKEGLRRKRAYEDNRKKNQESDSGLDGGRKRKAETITKEVNKKTRRKDRAVAAAQKKLAEEEAAQKKLAEGAQKLAEEAQKERMATNPLVKCNHTEKTPKHLSELLVYESREEWGPGSPAFVNRRFRADVRVVNYFPDKLEDFAVGRYESEYDILSDHSSCETDTDSGEDMEDSRRTKSWEWQFSLKVEDANPLDDLTPKKSIWVVIDNTNAQCLLGLDEDADNLRENNELLQNLRRQLEILWGDLEERKNSLLENLEKLESVQAIDSTEGKASPFKTKSLPLMERDKNLQSASIRKTKEDLLKAFNEDPKVQNRAFTCCIEEYGVKNSASGQTDVRQFAMFGTMITGEL